jgi:hypothetical protein
MSNKLCKKCNTVASFNVRGNYKREYCAKHKKENMVNVRYKLCAYPDCPQQYTFESKYCKDHDVYNDNFDSSDITNITTILTQLKDYYNYNDNDINFLSDVAESLLCLKKIEKGIL